ncbi:MAG: PIN domain-containing protein [Candidatus Micrarchaeota archaeon]|nr:PIN domain-containing protein [Candidatus Micrarchaeota archaeon]
MRYLFDTSSLIAFFNEEKGADFVKKLLEGIEHGVSEGFVSTITLTELFYIFYAKTKGSTAKDVIETIVKSKLKILPVDISTSLLAGKYKTRAIPLADALIAANASEVEAKVVTDDPHFSKTDVEIVNFRGH